MYPADPVPGQYAGFGTFTDANGQYKVLGPSWVELNGDRCSIPNTSTVNPYVQGNKATAYQVSTCSAEFGPVQPGNENYFLFDEANFTFPGTEIKKTPPNSRLINLPRNSSGEFNITLHFPNGYSNYNLFLDNFTETLSIRKAWNHIETSNYIVNAGTTVDMKAGKVITMKAGTHIKTGAGSIFRAHIEDPTTGTCNDPLYDAVTGNVIVTAPEFRKGKPHTSSFPTALDSAKNCIPIVLLEEIKKTGIVTARLYPNPTTSNVIVTLQGLPKGEVYSVHVQTALGALVRHFGSDLSELEIDLNGLSTGIYTVHIKGKNWNFIQKLIIQ